MKKQKLLLHACCMAFIVFEGISCLKPPPDFDPRDGNNDFKQCRIEKITFTTPSTHLVRTWTFVYNANNDPVTVTPSHIETGSPVHTFYYDKKGRLIQYVGFYANGVGYESFHKYVYDNHNVIVRDTQRLFGDYLGQPTPPNQLAVHYLSYDKLNRIKADSIVFGTGVSGVNRYNYDNNGNLIIPGASYDNKLNLHRTNKIWMFFDRNYSLNNPAGATKYNHFELPQIVEPNSYSLILGQGGDDMAVIRYSCD